MKKYVSLGMLLMLTGCAATHLTYVYDSSLGIDVAISTEGTQHVSIGYRQDSYATVPQLDAGEAMSLTAISHVSAERLDKVKFDHFVATGLAALSAAKDATGLSQIRQAVFGKQEKDTAKGDQK
ncbi:MAG: hypothetical protein ACKVN9_09365 [Methylophilaceae bacterium]